MTDEPDMGVGLTFSCFFSPREGPSSKLSDVAANYIRDIASTRNRSNCYSRSYTSTNAVPTKPPAPETMAVKAPP